MKLLWLDLNSSYAHSSLALAAIHAQAAGEDGVEWTKVSATINSNVGSVVADVVAERPDVDPNRPTTSRSTAPYAACSTRAPRMGTMNKSSFLRILP